MLGLPEPHRAPSASFTACGPANESRQLYEQSGERVTRRCPESFAHWRQPLGLHGVLLSVQALARLIERWRLALQLLQAGGGQRRLLVAPAIPLPRQRRHLGHGALAALTALQEPRQSDTWVQGNPRRMRILPVRLPLTKPLRCRSPALLRHLLTPPPPPPPSLPVPLPLGTAAGFFKSQGRPQLQARQGRPVAAGALACRGRAGPADPPRVPATWPAAAAAAGLIALCDPWLLPDILASLLAPRGYCLPCVATAFPRGYCLPSWLLPSLRAACQVWMLNIPGNGNPFAIFPGRPPAADLCSLLCPAPPLPPSARSAARATSGAASQAPYNASIGMLQRIGM